MATAFARAYHSLYDAPKISDDALVRALFAYEEYEGISAHMAQGIAFFDPARTSVRTHPEEVLRWVMHTQIAPTTLSGSRHTEDALENARMLGTKQYVVLGAGWDTFAFRHPGAGLDVFEVDHIATQRDKRRRIAGLGWELPGCLHFVACDFTAGRFFVPVSIPAA